MTESTNHAQKNTATSMTESTNHAHGIAVRYKFGAGLVHRVNKTVKHHQLS